MTQTAAEFTLGVDLASRYSAAVLLSPEGDVLGEWIADFGAADLLAPYPTMASAQMWMTNILHYCKSVTCDDAFTVVLEDLSHRMINPKPAIRTQAVVLLTLGQHRVDTLLVYPTVWQSALGFKRSKANSKVWAACKAEEFGYTPPPKTKAKPKTDLIDAFLIATWHRAHGGA